MMWRNAKLLISAVVIICTFGNVVTLRPILGNKPTWKVDFEDDLLNMKMKEKRLVQFTITGIDTTWENDFELRFLTGDKSILNIYDVNYAKNTSIGSSAWSGNFSVEAVFLGHTEITVLLERMNSPVELSADFLNVIILRNEDIWDQIFVAGVGAFFMILYVNFGAALDLKVLKGILLKPIGPILGLIGQFVVMPLTSYVIGYFLFRDMIELRLGLFFTGCAPGGGFSNIFTVVLNGNLDLSITMTAISNLVAFAMMPLWIFTLGSVIFHDGAIPIPYQKIAVMSWSFMIPLCIGIAMQIFYPKAGKVLAKLLKPISFVVIAIVMPFVIYMNAFIFKLFTYEIIIGSSALPWCGYLIGWAMATLLGQSQKDALTIGIETGIQNNGIAIFMLLVTLPQPQADMTSVVPMASSLMTPLPLLCLYLIKRCFCRASVEEFEKVPIEEGMLIEIEDTCTLEKKQIIA